MNEKAQQTGHIVRIAGPVVSAVDLDDVRLFDVVHVGEMGLIGEVIRLTGPLTTIQVYEDTGGLRIGETVVNSGEPLVVELGPGLLGSVYDGLQRPLSGRGPVVDFLARGASDHPPLPPEKTWAFTPDVKVGQAVAAGTILGTIDESGLITHAVMVPPEHHGHIAYVRTGQTKVSDVVAVLEENGRTHPITLSQRWPVRRPRPFQRKAHPTHPLITGTRIIDTFFPVAKGGAAIIPGGFGTGKTVTEQSLARWADADIVIYVGCGERGNEMAEVLREFPQLDDPRHGRPLMERTILIANTSNMPVAAREASIYTGVTLAEYYRDMGYDVLLLADSTSRWGEALREISGRLEEMPGEEGYPAYLATRLSEFYERSGRVVCLGDEGGTAVRTGSITIVGAVSPPGGDFSEPITQNSLRVVGTFWGLDYDLSRRRHFPAINWTRSYTLYHLEKWYAAQISPDWQELTRTAMALLQQEVELLEIVQLVGPDALAEEQKAILAVTRMLREDFLQQSALDEADRFCPLDEAYWMLRVIVAFHEWVMASLQTGVPLSQIMADPIVDEIAHMKRLTADQAAEQLPDLVARLQPEKESGD